MRGKLWTCSLEERRPEVSVPCQAPRDGPFKPCGEEFRKRQSAVVLKRSLTYRGSSRVGDRVQERRASPFAPRAQQRDETRGNVGPWGHLVGFLARGPSASGRGSHWPCPLCSLTVLQQAPFIWMRASDHDEGTGGRHEGTLGAPINTPRCPRSNWQTFSDGGRERIWPLLYEGRS